MTFGKIIGAIGIVRAPKNIEWSLACVVMDPVSCMSIALDLFCLTMSLMMPQAVLMSV